jgi:hypothetical protein
MREILCLRTLNSSKSLKFKCKNFKHTSVDYLTMAYSMSVTTLLPLFSCSLHSRRATKLYLSHLLQFFFYTTRGDSTSLIPERHCYRETNTFAYRGSSHRRKSAALHKFHMVWLYRSLSQGEEGCTVQYIVLVQMISTCPRRLEEGGGGGRNTVLQNQN